MKHKGFQRFRKLLNRFTDDNQITASQFSELCQSQSAVTQALSKRVTTTFFVSFLKWTVKQLGKQFPAQS